MSDWDGEKWHFSEEFIEKFTRAMAERAAEEERFFNSDEYSAALEVIRGYDRVVNSEDLAYNIQVIPGLSHDLFSKVCNATFHCLEEQTKAEDEGIFEVWSVEHRGIKFTLLLGQGGIYFAEALEQRKEEPKVP